MAVAALLTTIGIPMASAAQGVGKPPGAASVPLPPHPLFEGIALSDAQQQRVIGIRSRAIAEARVIHDGMLPIVTAMLKAQRQGDSAAAARYAAGVRAEQERLLELLARERSELRTVTTAAQRPRFDENKAKLDAKEAAAARPGK